ncbi:MAG: FAD-binding protein [Nitrospinota bacterium]|nr:MAG: FAD-binding protein [Nitrospinota bacterium]
MSREKWGRALARIVGRQNVIYEEDELLVYECDGMTMDKALPDVVVFPTTTAQVVEIVKWANQEGVPFIARGGGTGLSGGIIPVKGGIMIALNKMNQILEVDLENKRAVVQPGLVNLWLSEAVSDQGYHYVPDPSSQQACTIGGNVAENAGGPHTLKYGVTTNHVLGLEVVLPNGEVVEIGGKVEDNLGYDLRGLLIGSEGTLGIVTKVVVKIVRKPEAIKTLLGVFETVEAASNAVSAIIGRGIVPAAIEMMDQLTLQAVEDYIHAGYPLDAGAVLLIEVDGLKEGLDEQAKQIEEICYENKAREVRVAQDDKERALLWAGRKRAFGAIGRLSPTYYVQDGVIPRTKLPEVLQRIGEIGERYGLRIANVFHAGDGNLHPLILFDERDAEQTKRVLKASSEILKVCADVGGTISGEHGIGLEKMQEMSLIFSETDMKIMKQIRAVFNPQELCNPGKIFPTPGRCVELRKPPVLEKEGIRLERW